MSVVVVDPPEVEERRRLRKATVARRKRLVRRGGGCLLWLAGIAAVAGVVTWFVFSWQAQQDQRVGDEALARAKAAGIPMSRDEVALLVPLDSEIERATRRWREAIAKVDQKLFYGDAASGVPLIDGDRIDGGADPPTRDGRGRLQGKDLRLAKEFAAGAREMIEAAQAAREQGSVTNFALIGGGPVESRIAPPYALSLLRSALHLDAEVRLAEGDVAAAVEDLLTMIAVDGAMKNDLDDWWQQARHAGLERTVELVERALAVESLDDEQLRRLGEAFDDGGDAEAFRLAVAGARLNFVEWTRQDDAEFARLFGVQRASYSRGGDLAEGLDCIARIEEASERGLIPAADEATSVNNDLTTLAGEANATRRYPATFYYVPQIVDLARRHQRAEGQKALARTAIACERYRLANGSLPAKLDDLIPEYLSAVPVDPFDGQPLRYRSDSLGVRLYSVGADKTDEGGGAAVGSAAAAFAASDIVFRLKKSRAVGTPRSQE